MAQGLHAHSERAAKYLQLHALALWVLVSMSECIPKVSQRKETENLKPKVSTFDH
jgi:hypothetical protein